MSCSCDYKRDDAPASEPRPVFFNDEDLIPSPAELKANNGADKFVRLNIGSMVDSILQTPIAGIWAFSATTACPHHRPLDLAIVKDRIVPAFQKKGYFCALEETPGNVKIVVALPPADEEDSNDTILPAVVSTA